MFPNPTQFNPIRPLIVHHPSIRVCIFPSALHSYSCSYRNKTWVQLGFPRPKDRLTGAHETQLQPCCKHFQISTLKTIVPYLLSLPVNPPIRFGVVPFLFLPRLLLRPTRDTKLTVPCMPCFSAASGSCLCPHQSSPASYFSGSDDYNKYPRRCSSFSRRYIRM